MVPRENKNSAHAKFGGGGETKSIMVFSEVAHLYNALLPFHKCGKFGILLLGTLLMLL